MFKCFGTPTSAPAYLLLHGFLGGWEDWRATLQALPNAWGWCVNLRAVLAAPAREVTFTAYVEALAQRLRAAEVVEQGRPLHLVGYSLGARLALGLLLRYPQWWGAVSLIGVHPGLPLAQRQARWQQDCVWAQRLAQANAPAARIAFLQAWYAQPVFASQQAWRMRHAGNAAIAAAWLQRRARQPLATWAPLLRSTSLARMPNYLGALRGSFLPLQLLAGAADRRGILQLRRMQAVCQPQAVALLKACGHNPLLEAPQALACSLQQLQRLLSSSIDSHEATS